MMSVIVYQCQRKTEEDEEDEYDESEMPRMVCNRQVATICNLPCTRNGCSAANSTEYQSWCSEHQGHFQGF